MKRNELDVQSRLYELEQAVFGFDTSEKDLHYFGVKAQVRAILTHLKLYAPPGKIPDYERQPAILALIPEQKPPCNCCKCSCRCHA